MQKCPVGKLLSKVGQLRYQASMIMMVSAIYSHQLYCVAHLYLCATIRYAYFLKAHFSISFQVGFLPYIKMPVR